LSEPACSNPSVTSKATERAGAELLGRMIFAFSRLDMALGLCIVWTGGGRNIESLSNQVPNWTFHSRLDYLTELLTASRARDDADRIAYEAWIADAHALRRCRNDMVHGRWAVNGDGSKVANVVGLPTSSQQREVSYSLRELESFVDSLEALQHRLRELRKQHTL
jgi:hypothetical protein